MRGICMNEDNTNFFFQQSAGPYDEASLKKLIDHYDQGTVREIMFNVNAMRANYPSKVFDMIGDYDVPPSFEPSGEASAKRWIDSVQGYFANGIDPYAYWLAESRRRGISPWISLRVNDIHCVDNKECYMHSRLWQQHPEWRRTTGHEMWNWSDDALNFCIPEVREQIVALTGEVLERYDADGVELDWMRFPFHFRPGYEDEGRRITLEMHRSIREMADRAAERRGHPVKIAIRIPAHLEDAWQLGYDILAMCREKLVDVVIPTAFWATTDNAMPIALWRQILPPEVLLYAGIELNTRAYPAAASMYSTASMLAAQNCNYLAQGADRIYLFNYMDFMLANYADEFKHAMTRTGDLELAAASARRHVVTYTDTRAPGVPEAPSLPLTHYPAYLRIAIGTAPASSRKSCVLLGFESEVACELEVWLNGRKLDAATALPADRKVPKGVNAFLAYDAAGMLKNHENVLEIMTKSNNPPQIVWAEINIEP